MTHRYNLSLSYLYGLSIAFCCFLIWFLFFLISCILIATFEKRICLEIQKFKYPKPNLFTSLCGHFHIHRTGKSSNKHLPISINNLRSITR